MRGIRRFVFGAFAVGGALVGSEPERASGAAAGRSAPGREAVPTAARTPEPRPEARRTPGRLPMAFEENVGQFDSRARFRGMARGYNAYVTAADEAVLSLRSPEGRLAVAMRFEGASKRARLEPVRGRSGKSHYFLGRDPKGWRRGARLFESVGVTGLYRGVDLEWKPEDGRLRYDLRLAPDADLRQVRLRMDGAKGLSVDRSTGELVVATAAGEVRHTRPKMWEEAADGSALTFLTFFGGDGSDLADGIAVYDSTVVIIAGQTTSAEDTFPLQDALYGTYNGGTDGFVASLSQDGGGLSFSTYLGGDDYDEIVGVAVGGDGEITVVGTTASTESTFPVTVGPALVHNGGEDAFVARIALDGQELAFCGYIGGENEDLGGGLAVDADGITYVCGTTQGGTEFPNSTDVGTLTYNGGTTDAFIALVAPDGTNVEEAMYLGGEDDDKASAIITEGGSEAIVVGGTLSSEDTFPGASSPAAGFDGTYDGDLDAFVARVAVSSKSVVWWTYLGGIGDDDATGVAIRYDDEFNQHVLVCGRTSSSEDDGFPVEDPVDGTFNGGASDGFVVDLVSDGASVSFADFFGGDEDDVVEAIVARNGTSAIVFAGTTESSAGFPLEVGPSSSFGGVADVFVAEIDIEAATPMSLSLAPKFGNVTDHSSVKRDVIDVSGLFFFEESSDGEVHPGTEVVTIVVGPAGEEQTLVLDPDAMPDGVAWKVKGTTYTWASKKGAVPKWSVKIETKPTKESFRFQVTDLTFAAAIANPVTVRMEVGEDVGEDVATWPTATHNASVLEKFRWP